MADVFSAKADRTVVAQPGATICELIYVQLQRIHADQDHAPHEDEIVRLANVLLPGTKTYGVYVFAIYQALGKLDYAAALQIGRAMHEHETWLHTIAEPHDTSHTAALN